MMASWSPKQILALLLAVFVTAGFGFATVQANAMSVKMAMMSDSGTTMPSNIGMTTMSGSDSNCAACPVGSDDHGNPMSCSPVCVAPAFAVLPQDLTVATIVQTLQPSLSSFALLHGRTSLPDPFPPRPSDLV